MGHSVKIGASEQEGGPSLDAERIQALLADANPGEYFIVEANSGLSLEHTMRLLRILPRKLDFFRSPLCNLARTLCATQTYKRAHYI